MQWTDDQYKAISAKDGTLLVSAAAGSGKTAVLVERVVSRLEDKEHGCGADELLIVTFTKAATAQMREKIAASLEKRIAEHPGNTHLLRQQALLPFAQISTIDSFCADIVRENFQKLGIEPDYTIADDHQMGLMKEETAAEIVENFYGEDDGAFGELCELLFSGRDDRKLVDTLLKLDVVASSYADPERWLRSLYAGYDLSLPAGQSVWGRLAAQQGMRILDTCIAVTDNALRMIGTDSEVQEKYTALLLGERELFVGLKQTLQSDDWNAVREAVLAAPDKLPVRCPAVKGDSFEKTVAQTAHKSNKERVQKKLAALYCTTAEEYAEDCAYCLPLIRRLSEAVLAYRERLLAKKRAANSYEFSDISLFALQCLQEENGEKTPYAESLSQRFCEILVDEFQDVNEAQYILFQLLSRNGENLFMVGDAKQSIYKFRQARPDIFISLKNKYPLYEDGNYPALVQLDRNFRSRSGVTEWVNFTFRQLMYSPDSGDFEVNYDEREFLRAAAAYPPANSPDAQLHVVRYDRGEEGRLSAEARYIARWILEQLQQGLTVSDDGQTVRKATFSDFCILLRSDGGNMNRIAQTLLSYGIPAQTGAQSGFFEAPEIRFMLSLLQVLDNPLQDVPLLAVMLSPVFGFTADDLSALRIGDRRSPLYALVTDAAKHDSRYEKFLQTLSDYRMLCATMSAGEMLRRLMDETGYFAIAGAMTGGEGRQANLRLLQRMATAYEQTGKIGLSGFVRYLDKMEDRQTKVEKASAPASTANVVRIMTIHRSKGLEFPICILANTAAPFNGDEYKNNYIYHNTYGMATLRRDTQRYAQFETAPKNILNSKVCEANINEELRVLYVAMTRAKEKLVAVATYPNPEKRMAELALRCGSDGCTSGVLEMKSYADMLLCTALRHPDAHALRAEASIPGSALTVDAPFCLHTVLVKAPETEELPQTESAPQREVNAQLLQQIRDRTDYVYPYAQLALATAKHTASGMEEQGIGGEFFASSRPAFLHAGGLTPAQRGTVLHRFMQYADYSAAAEDVQKELDRLQLQGIFTQQESGILPVDAVHRFFRSETGQRMLRSPLLLREKRFAMEMDVRTLYPELPDNAAGETVVIQGMVDCAFLEDGKLYVVDYKTDREPPDVLRTRYKTQLTVYKTAMEQCTDYPVGGVLLYSFHNHCTIEI
ncbi:MAG: helicase-exonuclease AddAB subunit AddA [Oscillospiraceae bacterium]|nr:helicase-exonuclease AddAB subunit AddA [Oscillospiraceae bacterium]